MTKQTRSATFFAILFATVVATVLIILPGCAAQPASQASQAGYTERALKLISNVEDAPAELTVRFYDEAPNVPYFGIAQYKTFVLGDKTTVESDGKVASLTSTDGGVVTVDSATDKISSEDLAKFRIYIEPMLEGGKPCGILDLGAPFVRIASYEYRGEPQPISLDYGAYNIDLHVDDKDAYAPLASISDLLNDGYAGLFYNGTDLYLTDQYLESVTELDPDYYKHMETNHERPQDMVDYTYNNLCFLVDNLRGNTGSSALDELIAQKGLDKALDHDDVTRETRDMLKSTDFYEFLTGTNRLALLTYEGHTYLSDSKLSESSQYLESDQGNPELVSGLLSKTDLESSFAKKFYPEDGASPIAQRTELLGETPPTYREQGNTAVIILDNFLDYDEEGWKAHYASGSPIPTGEKTNDFIGTLIAGLQKAKENPNIKYVVLDVSCNPGGSSDLLETLNALLYGTAEFNYYDHLNGQFATANYSIDSLFDGTFKTEGFASQTNFTYAVLTSYFTFSCANAFAQNAKDAGLAILGEQSGGGEYIVTPTYFPEGLIGQVSYAPCQLVGSEGNGVEGGVPVDVDLVKKDASGARDYSDFYDMERLDEVMNSL